MNGGRNGGLFVLICVWMVVDTFVTLKMYCSMNRIVQLELAIV